MVYISDELQGIYYGECMILQGGSNMTGTDLCVNLATSVLVIFEPPCTSTPAMVSSYYKVNIILIF